MLLSSCGLMGYTPHPVYQNIIGQHQEDNPLQPNPSPIDMDNDYYPPVNPYPKDNDYYYQMPDISDLYQQSENPYVIEDDLFGHPYPPDNDSSYQPPTGYDDGSEGVDNYPLFYD